jgi:hypothetical protein
MKNQFSRTAIGAPEQWLIEAAASIGLDYTGLIHEVTNQVMSGDGMVGGRWPYWIRTLSVYPV